MLFSGTPREGVAMAGQDQVETVHTEKAPKAIGPYSQAVRVGKFVFTAGQIALDPSTGGLVGSEIGSQTRQVLTNLQNILAASDSGLDLVLKTTVFLHDMADFAGMNAVYAEFFGEHRPARSTVAVASLPRDALVEIEAVALARS
jgi:2-iminobutanoate/2-iminopropanoate deaminase